MLEGNFSYLNLNLDNFVNLKTLSLYGNINGNFNIELFKNLCNQLENLEIEKFDEETFLTLFDGHHFLNLKYLNLIGCCIKKVKKKIYRSISNGSRIAYD